LASAAGKRKAQLQELLAERFPRTEALPLVVAIPATSETSESPVPERVARNVSDTVTEPARAGTSFAEVAMEPKIPSSIRPKLAPIAQGRYTLQFSIGKEGYEKLRYAQALLA